MRRAFHNRAPRKKPVKSSKAAQSASLPNRTRVFSITFTLSAIPMTYFFTLKHCQRIMGWELLFKGHFRMKHQFIALAFAGLLGFTAMPAMADGVVEMTRLLKGGDAPTAQAKPAAPVSGDNTAIRLTPDRTKILRLRESAASVIVANPNHAAVTLDSPRLLILMPREPGTTSFTVLDAHGKVLLERNIIVTASAQPQYVRVRRVCGSNAQDCQPANYYYCPDGCFEVTPVAHEDNSNIPEVQGNAPALFQPAQQNAIPADPMILEEIEGPADIEDDSAADDSDSIEEATE